MAYYNICGVCGANLDPGEKCDCEEHLEERIKQSELIIEEKTRDKVQDTGKEKS